MVQLRQYQPVASSSQHRGSMTGICVSRDENDAGEPFEEGWDACLIVLWFFISVQGSGHAPQKALDR